MAASDAKPDDTNSSGTTGFWDGSDFDEMLEKAAKETSERVDAIQRFRLPFTPDPIPGYGSTGHIRPRRYERNHIVITFSCCPTEVPVGIFTTDDKELGFKYLPGVGGIACPNNCSASSAMLIRRPAKVVHPKSAAMSWVARYGNNGKLEYPVENLFLYFRSYFLDAMQDIKTREGTYHMTDRDREYLSPLQLADGWRTYVRTKNNVENVYKVRVCKRNPDGPSPSPHHGHMKDTHFVLSDYELEDGWCVVYCDREPLAKRLTYHFS